MARQLCWVGAVIMVVVIAALPLFGDAKYPEMRCDPMGQDFICVVTECEKLKHFPEWTHYTIPRYTAPALSFTDRATDHWTIIECDIRDDIDKHIKLRVWVRYKHGKTMFQSYTEDNVTEKQK